MKKLKTLFSPRKLVVWLFVLTIIIAMPELTRPSLSQTDALVSMLCVEKSGEDFEIAATVLTPGEERKVNNQIYTGKGATLGEAVNNVAISLGKEMAFAQCEIIAFGENISNEGIIPAIDYMTRTKRVGRSAILINFTGKPQDFAQAVSKLGQEKSLRLDQIMHFDERYILSKNSNIDSFYKGYFSPIKTSIMPLIKLEDSQTTGAIEVSTGQSSTSGSGGASSSGTSQEESKKYLINDGSMCVFYNGAKRLELTPEEVKDINILQDNEQEGVLKVENVKDEIYSNATIVFTLTKKNIELKPKFEGEIPVFEMNIEIRVLVDEVLEQTPDERFLRRNKEFLTPTALAKLKETLNEKLLNTIEFCKQNQIDLISAYRYFNAMEYNKFKEYYEKYKENYLEGIDYRISIEINSSY